VPTIQLLCTWPGLEPPADGAGVGDAPLDGRETEGVLGVGAEERKDGVLLYGRD
jgi:hypothetical protein